MGVLALNDKCGRLPSVKPKYWKVVMAYLKVLSWN